MIGRALDFISKAASRVATPTPSNKSPSHLKSPNAKSRGDVSECGFEDAPIVENSFNNVPPEERHCSMAQQVQKERTLPTPIPRTPLQLEESLMVLEDAPSGMRDADPCADPFFQKFHDDCWDQDGLKSKIVEDGSASPSVCPSIARGLARSASRTPRYSARQAFAARRALSPTGLCRVPHYKNQTPRAALSPSLSTRQVERHQEQLQLLRAEINECEEQRKFELVGEIFLKFSENVISVRFMFYEFLIPFQLCTKFKNLNFVYYQMREKQNETSLRIASKRRELLEFD